MREMEFMILDFIQNHMRTPVGDVLMPFVTKLGNQGMLWIFIGMVLLVKKNHRKVAILLFLALLIEVLICNVYLKNAIASFRPCDLNTSVQLLIAKPEDYSFPSGHTGASFAAVTALYLGKEKLWYIALIPAVFIAFSRLYLYVHFPIDILGGIIVGIISGFLAYGFVAFLQNRSRKRNKSKI